MNVTKEQIQTSEQIIRREFPDAALIQFNLQIDFTKHHVVSLWACCVRFKDNRPGFETEPRETLLDAVTAALKESRPQAMAEKTFLAEVDVSGLVQGVCNN